METRDLIATLAGQGAKRTGPAMARMLGIYLAAALAYCVIAIVAFSGVRPDILAAGSWVLIKAGLSLVFAICAIPLALRAAQPGRRAGLWGGALAVVFVVAVIAACGATAAVAPDGRLAAVTGGGFPHIIVVVPTLAIPPAALLMVWMRRQAPTRPMLAGASAGAAAGAIAAMAYALTCPVDAAPFIAAAYTTAIGICALACAVVGRYALRW
jgi:hypothetical protein